VNEKTIALRTVEVTRSTLERILLKPEFLIAMIADKVTPEDVNLMVKDILEYLDKTKETLK